MAAVHFINISIEGFFFQKELIDLNGDSIIILGLPLHQISCNKNILLESRRVGKCPIFRHLLVLITGSMNK